MHIADAKRTSKSQDKRLVKMCWDQHETWLAPSITARGLTPNVYSCDFPIPRARHEPGTPSLGLAENPLDLALVPAPGP